MHVSLHARHTALYRVFRQQGLRETDDQIAFHRLDRAWERHCGLRRADLLDSIGELSEAGQIQSSSGPEGMVMALTDRGSQTLKSPLLVLRSVCWSRPVGSAIEALQTLVTLYRARLRTRRFLRRSPTLVIDRRGRA